MEQGHVTGNMSKHADVLGTSAAYLSRFVPKNCKYSNAEAAVMVIETLDI